MLLHVFYNLYSQWHQGVLEFDDDDGNMWMSALTGALEKSVGVAFEQYTRQVSSKAVERQKQHVCVASRQSGGGGSVLMFAVPSLLSRCVFGKIRVVEEKDKDTPQNIIRSVRSVRSAMYLSGDKKIITFYYRKAMI